MSRFEDHVYYNSKNKQITVFSGSPSWVGPNYEFMGVLEHDAYDLEDDVIREWVWERLGLYGMERPVNMRQFNITNYARHAYRKDESARAEREGRWRINE